MLKRTDEEKKRAKTNWYHNKSEYGGDQFFSLLTFHTHKLLEYAFVFLRILLPYTVDGGVKSLTQAPCARIWAYEHY